MRKMLLIFLMLCLTMSQAFATKVSPVRYDVSINRGESKQFTINLTGSKGAYNQNLLIYPSDLFMSRTGALSFDLIVGNKNSAVSWIKMERNELSLLEEQSKELKFKISIPSNATPGEYYAVIMVEPKTFTDVKDKKNPVMLQMKTRVAIVVVLDVPGRTYEKKGEIGETKVLETDKLVKLSSSFKNTGDIHLDVVAEATIRSADGKINFGKFNLKALSSAKDEAFIFPSATRDFEGAFDRQLPKGDYIAEVSFDYGYAFKKAKKTEKFSITRETLLDESKAEFLSVKTKEFRLLVPQGASKMQVVQVTNIDYRPLQVTAVELDWIKVSPNTFTLKPGEVRNILLNIKVPTYDASLTKEATLSLKTDRGKASDLQIFATGVKEKLEKKIEIKKEIKK